MSLWTVFTLALLSVGAWVVLARTFGVYVAKISWRVWRGTRSREPSLPCLPQDGWLAFVLFPVSFCFGNVGRMYYRSFSPVIVRYAERHDEGSSRAKPQYLKRAAWLFPVRVVYCLCAVLFLVFPLLFSRLVQRLRDAKNARYMRRCVR